MSHPRLPAPEEALADAKKRLSLPRIVVICGSTRFMTEMTEADVRETTAGRIVVKPGCDMKSPHALWSDPVEAEALKARLDELHRAKIRLADECSWSATTSGTAPEPRSPTPGHWTSPCASPIRKSTPATPWNGPAVHDGAPPLFTGAGRRRR